MTVKTILFLIFMFMLIFCRKSGDSDYKPSSKPVPNYNDRKPRNRFKSGTKSANIPVLPKPLSNDFIYSGVYFSKMPINEFLINRSSRFIEGETYYVYFKHNPHVDMLSQGMDWTVYTVHFEYDIIPKQSHIAHILCEATITNKGSFAYYPKSVQYIYKDGTTESHSCDGFELLYQDSAVVEIFNRTGPHPNCPWKTIQGSIVLQK